MFAGAFSKCSFLQHILHTYISPPICPRNLADDIVSNMEQCVQPIIYRPFWAGWLVGVLALLPTILSDEIVAFAGGVGGMEGFSGRPSVSELLSKRKRASVADKTKKGNNVADGGFSRSLTLAARQPECHDELSIASCVPNQARNTRIGGISDVPRPLALKVPGINLE